MKESDKIRFIATNFVTLQGLRIVPIGVLMFLIGLLTNSLWANGVTFAVLWTNELARAAEYFAFLGVIIVVTIISIIIIDKYYSHNFGVIKRTPESIRFEWLIQIVGSILLLGAFWVDITFRLPVNCIGLLFAATLIAEYFRLTWLVRGRYLIYYPLGAFFIAFVSILPLFGIPKWWLAFGLVNNLVGIEMAVGIFCISAGLWGHLFFLRALSTKLEVYNDHTL